MMCLTPSSFFTATLYDPFITVEALLFSRVPPLCIAICSFSTTSLHVLHNRDRTRRRVDATVTSLWKSKGIKTEAGIRASRSSTCAWWRRLLGSRRGSCAVMIQYLPRAVDLPQPEDGVGRAGEEHEQSSTRLWSGCRSSTTTRACRRVVEARANQKRDIFMLCQRTSSLTTVGPSGVDLVGTA